MPDVNAVELPEFDPSDTTLNDRRFHETMAELAADYEVGEATIFRALKGPFELAA